jgi:hypothetical protein
MIVANIYDRARAEICRVWLRGCPQAGDILWLSSGSGPATLPPPGTSMRISRVEHVCDTNWRPDINLGAQPPHSLIIYVEPRQ